MSELEVKGKLTEGCVYAPSDLYTDGYFGYAYYKNDVLIIKNCGFNRSNYTRAYILQDVMEFENYDIIVYAYE